MTGTPRETRLRRTASAKSSGTRSTLLPIIRLLGPVMEAVPDGTSSRDFPSAWYTDCAGTEWKSSPWRTVGVGQATGGRGSETVLPNSMFDRTAGSHSLAAAGQHERWASKKPNGDDELE